MPNKQSGDAAMAQVEQRKLLSEVIEEKNVLSRQDRLLLVNQALALLEMCYIHLPQKRAMYAVDPVQRLRLLKYHIDQSSDSELSEPFLFHNEMFEIFTLVRDLHTNYLPVSTYSSKTAFLPFLMEEYFDPADNSLHYLVTKVDAHVEHVPPFGVGVEILYWNGTKIRRAIEINAESQAGSNLDARYQRGLSRMTIRPLWRSVPPVEDWVTLRYRAPDGSEHDTEYKWYAYDQPPEMSADYQAKATGEALAFGYDVQWAQTQEVRKTLYAPAAAQKMEAMPKEGRLGIIEENAANKYESQLPLIFSARDEPKGSGEFGYIRVYSFMHPSADEFVAEFNRLMHVLPQNGLIIDVRSNGGGNILASEQVLQLLTKEQVEPARFQFINSPLTLALARRFTDLNVWQKFIAQSVETGALQSLAFPITSPDSLAAVKRRFKPKHRKIVLITDALCYSATDIFAAGFQDNKIGKILGTAGNTGAGGANVWTHSDLCSLVSRLDPDDPMRVMFKPLPGGAEMRVAIRRCLRVGQNAGIPVEDLGIEPDQLYRLTKRDLLENNVDLLKTAADMLRAM